MYIGTAYLKDFLHKFRPLSHKLNYKLPKKSIRPGEPASCVIIWIVFVEGLMHKESVCICALQSLQTLSDFILIFTSIGFNYDTHRPYHVIASMKASYPFTRLTTIEKGVVL